MIATRPWKWATVTSGELSDATRFLLLVVVVAVAGALLAPVSGNAQTTVNIPITSPTQGQVYQACINITWTSLVGAGDFDLHFDAWRANTTWAPIHVQDNVPYTRGSDGGFSAGIPCSAKPGLYYITGGGTSPTGVDFVGTSGVFNMTSY
ncbi:hypothetical protein DFJ74DRAFT_708088 [Hyaloraphidium curvatum]|nr:hypothetical protein DFJ74DRAFT_708088 [Hyaloraphidium curvatum]